MHCLCTGCGGPENYCRTIELLTGQVTSGGALCAVVYFCIGQGGVGVVYGGESERASYPETPAKFRRKSCAGKKVNKRLIEFRYRRPLEGGIFFTNILNQF